MNLKLNVWGGSVEPIIQRRISDVSFVIDKNLNVLSAKRSFLRLFNITDSQIQLSSCMDENDAANFKYFLANFSEKSETPYFVVTLLPVRSRIRCLFYVEKQDECFHVDVKELNYSRELLENTLIESREYIALLKNFDVYYFLFDGTKFSIKNTKDFNTVFECAAENTGEFAEFVKSTFKIDFLNGDTKAQFDSLLVDIKNFDDGKNYLFLQTDKKLLSVHTTKSCTRNQKVIVGNISYGIDSVPSENSYNEKIDFLTGLYNKKAITDLAHKKINEEKYPCTMIVMDVDKFKECNDTCGHAFGDKVLSAVSTCVKDAISGIGFAGRIGGDEFLIILDKTKEDDVRNVLRNIRVGIQWSITPASPDCVVTCSMGVARFPMNAANYDELFSFADKSLYLAKNKGRNCYIIYKPELHDSVMAQDEKNALKISSGEFYASSSEKELEITERLIKNTVSPAELKSVLDLLVDYLSVHTINVYDRDLKLVFQAGKEMLDIRNDYFDSKYFAFFNDYGFCHLDNTNVLNSLDKRKFEMFLSVNISTTLEVICNDENGARRAFVCFDIYKPARTFSKEKLIFALLAAKLIAKHL